ncbi:hypothetical protein CPHO_08440 [Corynebacterium phocae]|uniref:DNA methylase adenine-specific domain-containing protein n=1 Tax=Corynebacterium phocae TaxID=161895 RepID=A0A1L7D4H6_9CORY|nr:hypothetical protein [Corynebacterium phocae]APT92911.1 hypothetical protein CPHO_08440 [Corynebacterium phocae]KAA8723236.1 hypothetical protein F4V58_07940 [Corynebacterium phocae]
MTRQADLAKAYEQSTSSRRASSDGVVTTPVEVVDFINRSAWQQTRQRFGVDLDHGRVQLIDPFAGTGIFFARLLETAPPDKVQGLVNNMFGLEVDPAAAAIADNNIRQVAQECGATPPDRPLVICADTFAIPNDQDIPALFDQVHRTGTHPYQPKGE